MATKKIIAVALLVASIAITATAQRRGDRGPGGPPPRGDNSGQGAPGGQRPDYGQPPPPPQNNSQNSQSGNQQPQNPPPVRFHGRGPHAGDWLRRFGTLPPDKQQQQLEKDPQFKELPPDRQERLRNRLHNFNALPQDQRQRILNRMELFEHMSPEQQDRMKQMFSQFRAMAPDRRHTMVRTLRQLREMSPEERQRTIDSPSFRNNYTDKERELLRGMSTMEEPPEGDGSPQEP